MLSGCATALGGLSAGALVMGLSATLASLPLRAPREDPEIAEGPGDLEQQLPFPTGYESESDSPG